MLLFPLFLAFLVPARAAPRLYWFVPDGLRADPKVCDVYRWASEGKLPNIKRMMERGAWGYSIPAFPSHTPANFATLMTGAYPEVHGIADGPMRVEGRPLAKASINGFSSAAKKVAPIWKTLEDAGLKVAVVSVPGSTPPELDAGWTVRGRWGNWGADFPALNFESLLRPGQRAERGLDIRLFYQGPELTRYVAEAPASGWTGPESKAQPLELPMLAYGTTVYAYLGGEKGARYDSVSLSFDKKAIFGRLARSDAWTPWVPVTLRWQGQPIETRMRAGLIRLAPDGYVKLRLLFDTLNATIVEPGPLADDLRKAVGPMVDFPDNWPAQLNRLPEEREVLRTEAGWALAWHRAAARWLLKSVRPDVLIQDTYVPNQMLESRWWLKHLDPASPRFASTTARERAARRRELLEMYRGIDSILGEAIKAAPEAIIALSSDHGILAIKKEVLVNDLLAQEGLLTFRADPESGEPVIDWAASKAAYLKMIGVYVNPAGLAGDWKRGNGPEYQALRERVAKLLRGVKDGKTPVVREVVPWEEAGRLKLPQDRAPDLILSMAPGYALSEDMRAGGPVLREALQSGYKQAVFADGVPELRTPFLVMGPGVRKGVRIPEPVQNVDQEPTLLKLLGVASPGHVQGRVIAEILEKP